MLMPIAPEPTYGNIQLSNTSLHYVNCGSGPPLVIVPATVSLISQWQPLAQFVGQRYTTYFFELPGHGGSTAYPEAFASRMVPPTVAEFMDAMGHDTFNLMGFSFGGLLAMRTLEALQGRIEHVILLSPCVTRRALKYSTARQWGFRQISKALMSPTLQDMLARLLYSGRFDGPLIFALSKVSSIEKSILESKDALRIPQTTLDVLAYTVSEIFTQEYSAAKLPFRQPCYFAMSINDDLLKYGITLNVVRQHFSDLTIQRFTHPYHQPPEPPTFDWLNAEFGQFLELLPPK